MPIDMWQAQQEMDRYTRQARARGVKALFSRLEVRHGRPIFHVLPEDKRIHLVAARCWCGPDESSDLVEHVWQE